MAAGLSSAPACVRVIIRDVAGKHSWDSAVLYGPPPCPPSSPAHTQSPHSAHLHLRSPMKKMAAEREDSEEDRQEDSDSEGGGSGMDGERQEFEGDEAGEEREFSEEEKERQRGGEREEEEQEQVDGKWEHTVNAEGNRGEPGLEQLLAPPLAKRVCREMVPAWDSMREEEDSLDEMLQYLGYSSPECLQRAGIHDRHTYTHKPVSLNVLQTNCFTSGELQCPDMR